MAIRVFEKFDSKQGILSYKIEFPPCPTGGRFVLDFDIITRKKTARKRMFKDLPDLQPVAVFDWVKIDDRGKDPLALLAMCFIERKYDCYLAIFKRTEYYKVGSIFVVVTYKVCGGLSKDYLLIINKQKIAIPKPKLSLLNTGKGKIVYITFESEVELDRMLKLSMQLDRILQEKLFDRSRYYPRLVFVDPKYLEEKKESFMQYAA